MRKVRKAILEKNSEESVKEFKTLVSKLDRAATRKVIHANSAARLKSRLSAAIKALNS